MSVVVVVANDGKRYVVAATYMCAQTWYNHIGCIFIVHFAYRI
jgi:hypothetical protein